jgi:hypothetical protein
MAEEAAAMGDFCLGTVARLRHEHEEEVLELRGEIERQHKVISSMRKEVEDLQELMIMQSEATERDREGESSQTSQNNLSKEREENESSPQGRTFGGL